MSRTEWNNFATWCIHFSLKKDEATRYTWMASGRDAYLKAQSDETFSKMENAQRILAGWLKKEITDGNPLESENVYSDLLTAALSGVNWNEIARTFLPEE